MTTEQRPREWKIWNVNTVDQQRQAVAGVDCPDGVHVIEHSAYEALRKDRDDLREWRDTHSAKINGVKAIIMERDALKAKLEEMLSYLPKVPTQSYEKELAQKLATARAALEWLAGVDESKPYCTYYERTLDDGTTVPMFCEIARKALGELGE